MISCQEEVRTNERANVVLSPLGKCSSSAKTIQLAIIVNSTMYSNGLKEIFIQEKQINYTWTDFHSITAFARFRIQLLLEKMNNER